MFTHEESKQSQTNRNTSNFFKTEGFQILTVTKAYLSKLVVLAKKTYMETYPDYFKQEELEALFGKEALSAQLKDKKSTFFIAQCEGRSIGYAKIVIKNEQALLDKLYLLKAFQGRGYGKELLTQCLSYTYNCKLNSIKLHVFDQNIRAIDFYSKNGFVLKDEKMPYLRPDGSDTTEYDLLMECSDIGAFLFPETSKSLYSNSLS